MQLILHDISNTNLILFYNLGYFTSLGQNTVNFIHQRLYGAMFLICDQDSVDNTLVFSCYGTALTLGQGLEMADHLPGYGKL